MSVFRAI